MCHLVIYVWIYIYIYIYTHMPVVAAANGTRQGRKASMALGVVGLVLASPLLFLLTRAAWITVSCYYLTPARIRTILAGQGVHGPPPRLLVGNLHDVSALVSRATAGDMSCLSHDIVGRLLPHYVLWSKMYGEWLTMHCRPGGGFMVLMLVRRT